jgi:hypothetical protein
MGAPCFSKTSAFAKQLGLSPSRVSELMRGLEESSAFGSWSARPAQSQQRQLESGFWRASALCSTKMRQHSIP